MCIAAYLILKVQRQTPPPSSQHGAVDMGGVQRGARDIKGAAVKAAEVARREKTETVSVCYAANSLLRNGEASLRFASVACALVR